MSFGRVNLATTPSVPLGADDAAGSYRAGDPFVGPRGQAARQGARRCGNRSRAAPRDDAVKYFKFTRAERGKRRIDKTPSRTEVVACRPWLIAELTSVRPDLVVLLGATGAKSLLGNDFRLTAHHSEVLKRADNGTAVDLDVDPRVVATVHPSSVLRGPPEDRDKAFEALVADLRFAAGLLH